MKLASIIIFIIGIAIGMYIQAAQHAIKLPTIKMGSIGIDNGVLFAVAVLIVALMLRSKTVGSRKPTQRRRAH